LRGPRAPARAQDHGRSRGRCRLVAALRSLRRARRRRARAAARMTGKEEDAENAGSNWRSSDKGPSAPAGEAPEESEPRSVSREAGSARQIGSPGSLLSVAQAAVNSVQDVVTSVSASVSLAATSAQGSSQELGTILSSLPPRLRMRYREYRRALIKRGYYPSHLGLQLDSIPEHGELLEGVGSRAAAGGGSGGGLGESATALANTASAVAAGTAAAPTESRASIQDGLAPQPSDHPDPASSAEPCELGVAAVGASVTGASLAAGKRSPWRSLPRALLEERESPDSFGFMSQSPEDRWTHHRLDWMLLASSVLVAMCAVLYYIGISLRSDV
jgi:hypothetical protein